MVMRRTSILIVSAVSLAGCGDAPTPPPAKAVPALARCTACHRIDASAGNANGPNLAGVLGRAAASQAGFRYSPALQRSGLTWDRATLDRYLADPMRVVPQGRMTQRIPDPAERAAAIDALAALKP